MGITLDMKSNIIIYENEEGNIAVEVSLIDETLWLSLNQIANLFGRDKSVISRHINNIYREKELYKNETVAYFATVQKEGKKQVTRDIEYYNLDAILSVGYRVNSKQGTHFRKWANSVLKEYLVKGFSTNEKRLAEKGLREIEESLSLISKTLEKHNVINDLTVDTLNIVRNYTKSWSLLLKYDEDRLELPNASIEICEVFSYAEAKKAIKNLYNELKDKDEATNLFGKEKSNELDGIIGNLNQTFGRNALYPSNYERAAHLLYFIIKDHPFVDGNKRIGSFLFMLYLESANISIIKVSDNTLVALALLVAESEPAQKDLIIRLIVNLLI
jgi:DNA ligase (NAD+)